MNYIKKLLILALSVLFFGQADAMQGVRRVGVMAGKRFVPKGGLVNQASKATNAPKMSNALKAKYIAGGAALGAAGTIGGYYGIIKYLDKEIIDKIDKADQNAAIETENTAKIKAQLNFEAEERAKARAHDKIISDKIANIKASGINKIDKDGFTPLILAAKEGVLDLVNGLIANGAQVNMKHHWYKDYLLFGSRLREPIIEAAGVKGNIEVLKALIDAGARVNAREYYNGQKITPLIKAITNNDFEAVKLLVEKGANVGKGHFVRYKQKEHSYNPGKDSENPLRNLPPRTHIEYIAYRYNPTDLAELLGYYEIANFLRAKQIQKRL